MTAVAILIIVTVLGVATYFGQRARLRRKRLLPIVAHRAGMSFSEIDPFNCAGVAFPLFRAGDGRTVENVMWREAPNGNPVRVFDYSYFVERRDNTGEMRRTWHYFSCATIEHGGNWPRIRITRRSFVDRIGEALGIQDVDLESEEFNKMFTLQCDNPKFATDLIDPQMMEFLLTTEGKVDFATRGRFLLVSCSMIEDATLIPILAEIASRFIKHIPAVVGELYPNFPGGGGDTTDMPPVPSSPGNPNTIDNWFGLGPYGLGSDAGYTAFEFEQGPDYRSPDRLDPTPGIEHDINGNPMPESNENPWGEGRDLAGH